MTDARDEATHVYEVPLGQRVLLGVVLVPMWLAALASVVVLRLPGMLFLGVVAYLTWTLAWQQPYRITVHPNGSLELQALGGRSISHVREVTSVAFRSGPRTELVLGGRRVSPPVGRPGGLLRDLIKLNPALHDQLTARMRDRLARAAR